jgi:hypothetical protein
MKSLTLEFQKTRSLRRAIIRRIWYAFLLTTFLRPATVFGLLFGGSAIAFWRLVSITSIVENLIAVGPRNIPNFIANALALADTAALLAFAILCTVGVVATFRALRIGLTEFSHVRAAGGY